MGHKKIRKKRSITDKKVSPIRTICEVHRELHDILLGNNKIPNDVADEMIDLLEEAYHMGKKMDNKLRQYKYNYDDGWWKLTRDSILKEKLKKRGSKEKLGSIKSKIKKGNYKT